MSEAVAPVLVSHAKPEDIAFILQTERLPGYEALVGRWPAEKHAAAMADPRYAHFIACIDHRPVGFGMVRDWDSEDGATFIKRIAISQPGRGVGRMLVAGILDRIFQETAAHRVWISHLLHNQRAGRSYQACGFVYEGIARGSALFGGAYVDERIMAILRPEWQALRAKSSS